MPSELASNYTTGIIYREPDLYWHCRPAEFVTLLLKVEIKELRQTSCYHEDLSSVQYITLCQCKKRTSSYLMLLHQSGQLL